MGVALGWAVRNLRASSPEIARVAATQGLPLLEAAVRDRPDDLSARESLGHALAILGRREEGLQVFEEVLRIEPGRELALRSSGRLLTRLERPDRARIALQKAIAVNPWMSDYHLALAGVCYIAEDWPAAVAACRDAIRLNPELFEARSLLVQCYLRAHMPDKADAEFQIMLRFYPASRDVWQQWYEQQKRAGSNGPDRSATGEH